MVDIGCPDVQVNTYFSLLVTDYDARATFVIVGGNTFHALKASIIFSGEIILILGKFAVVGFPCPFFVFTVFVWSRFGRLIHLLQLDATSLANCRRIDNANLLLRHLQCTGDNTAQLLVLGFFINKDDLLTVLQTFTKIFDQRGILRRDGVRYLLHINTGSRNGLKYFSFQFNAGTYFNMRRMFTKSGLHYLAGTRTDQPASAVFLGLINIICHFTASYFWQGISNSFYLVCKLNGELECNRTGIQIRVYSNLVHVTDDGENEIIRFVVSDMPVFIDCQLIIAT